jgi:hypothetical protein
VTIPDFENTEIRNESKPNDKNRPYCIQFSRIIAVVRRDPLLRIESGHARAFRVRTDWLPTGVEPGPGLTVQEVYVSIASSTAYGVRAPSPSQSNAVQRRGMQNSAATFSYTPSDDPVESKDALRRA